MKKKKVEQNDISASLSGTILKKLSTLEDLLKKKDDKPFTFKEACAYLGYAPSYLYKLTYRKVIPHYKPTGKIIFFSKTELDEWIFKSRNQNSEISRQNENDTTESGSLPLTAKDPNQMEIELKEEVVVEFPRKKKR